MNSIISLYFELRAIGHVPVDAWFMACSINNIKG
jgi:hypothetical protein